MGANRQLGINPAIDRDDAALPDIELAQIPHIRDDAGRRHEQCAVERRRQHLRGQAVGDDDLRGGLVTAVGNCQRERDPIARLEVAAEHLFLDGDIRARWGKPRWWHWPHC